MGSEPIRGLLTFQRRLAGALARSGLAIMPTYRFQPHLTLTYGHKGQDVRAIDGISWLVEDFVLIESFHGERRHEQLDQWMLRTSER